MAEIQYPSIFGSYLQGQNAGNQQRQLRETRADDAALRGLAPSIINGDPAAFAQAAAIDPNAAGKFQDAGDSQLRRLKGAISYIEQAEASGNPQAVEAAYRQVRPYLSRTSPEGVEPPLTYAEAKPKMLEAKAQIAMLDAQEKQQRNMVVSPGSAVTDADGNILYERPYTPKNQTIEVEGPDGRTRRYSYDQINNSYKEATLEGEGAGPSAGLPQTPGVPAADVESIQNDYRSVADKYGLRITSMDRSESENSALPGAAQNSQHKSKTAVDYSTQGLTPEKIAQVEQEMKAKGYEGGYTNRGTAPHMHFELPPNRANLLRNSNAVVAGPAFTSRRKEDEAEAVERAKSEVQLAYLPQTEAIKAESAIRQAAGTEEAKGRVETRLELEQNLPKIMDNSSRAVNLLTKALNHPGLVTAVGASSKLDPRNMIPGTEAANFRVLLDQIKGGTFLEAFQSLKGGGAITETEGRKAEQAIGRLDTAQSEEEFKVALNELLDIARNAPAKAQAKLANFSGNASSPAATERRARNPQTGEVLVLRNGQWVPE